MKNNMKKKSRKRLTYTQLIAISFAAVIITGSVLLCLPLSAQNGRPTPFIDALFTAASATCVTGLTVVTTAAHWSFFGKIVILILIQIGGLGLMTLIAVLSVFANKQLGLQSRRLLTQSAGSMRLSDTDTLIKKIVVGTVSMEVFGAICLSIRFIPRYGPWRGIWLSVFHAVSSFCNAGFDVLGESSFSEFRSDIYVNTVLILLIIVGGLGFYVWNDLILSRLKPSKMRLQTKLVLTVSGILFFGGAVWFFFEEKNHSMQGFSVGERLTASFFQSATLRTAGFYTIDQQKLSQGSSMLSSALMLIGGSPGSTAGGLKTTTVAVTLASAFYAGRTVSDVTVFKRRIDERTIKQAAAIVHVYIAVLIAGTVTLCVLEPVSLADGIFEIASAMGTVGLTTGITPQFCNASKLLIILLMFGGRIGGLSMVTVFAEKKRKVMLERPSEKILIG